MERINTCGMGHDDRPCPSRRFSGDDLPVAFAGPRGRFRQGTGGFRNAHGPLPNVLFCSVSETIGVIADVISVSTRRSTGQGLLILAGTPPILNGRSRRLGSAHTSSQLNLSRTNI